MITYSNTGGNFGNFLALSNSEAWFWMGLLLESHSEWGELVGLGTVLAQNKGQIRTGHSWKPTEKHFVGQYVGFEFLLIFEFQFWYVFPSYTSGQLLAWQWSWSPCLAIKICQSCKLFLHVLFLIKQNNAAWLITWFCTMHVILYYKSARCHELSR